MWGHTYAPITGGPLSQIILTGRMEEGHGLGRRVGALSALFGGHCCDTATLGGAAGFSCGRVRDIAGS